MKTYLFVAATIPHAYDRECKCEDCLSREQWLRDMAKQSKRETRECHTTLIIG